jgi:hypothetical protein
MQKGLDAFLGSLVMENFDPAFLDNRPGLRRLIPSRPSLREASRSALVNLPSVGRLVSNGSMFTAISVRSCSMSGKLVFRFTANPG